MVWFELATNCNRPQERRGPATTLSCVFFWNPPIGWKLVTLMSTKISWDLNTCPNSHVRELPSMSNDKFSWDLNTRPNIPSLRDATRGWGPAPLHPLPPPLPPQVEHLPWGERGGGCAKNWILNSVLCLWCKWHVGGEPVTFFHLALWLWGNWTHFRPKMYHRSPGLAWKLGDPIVWFGSQPILRVQVVANHSLL